MRLEEAGTAVLTALLKASRNSSEPAPTVKITDLRLRHFFHHPWRPLVIAKHAQALVIAPAFFGLSRKRWPDAVILAQRIPAGENETTNVN